ncbi:MAG TPA: carboxypeptidase regulatory-like domain-containing protein [Bryobacteraceae bacterium]|nr:carboxypeptidase regulatory-like domain-containing protein [Bryobacteraceae bacterium]
MKNVPVTTIFLAFLMSGLVAYAQTDARVSGTVSDPSGAAVVAATVTALNTSTGAATPVTTNEAGVYTMPSLPPGNYSFTAEHPGFRKAVIADVVLQVGTVLTLNMGLDLGQTTETVEVQATATAVNATSASVGSVVEGKKLLDLPLAGRSAYDLLLTQPGVQLGTNFYLNGNQGNATSFTMDGISAMDNLHNSAFYLYSNVVSVDRAEEFRVVTSPADAEYGRGSGQVQMVTRGGTNRFVGSTYWEVRNAEFNANTYFNNVQGSPRSQLKQNNYGIRFGGPVKRNKTFFNGIYEPYKQRNFTTRNSLVYTAPARDGIYRFFPGALNQNATGANPTVDLSGNPVTPSGATGALQSVNVLGRDPNRLVVDPTGSMAHVLSYMPLPNNFRFGDGLNTAAYSWNQPTPVDFELYEGRIDHLFNEKHRIAITLNQQSYHSYNVASPPPFPLVPGNSDPTETTQYSAALTSVLRPNLLNDARIGIFRYRTIVQAPNELNQPGADNSVRKALLPVINGNVAVVTPTTNVTSPYGVTPGGIPGSYLDPTYQWGDDLTWIKGRHSFKGGFVLRYISLSGFDFGSSNLPSVRIGAPAVGATNFLSGAAGIAIPGIGQNATSAQNLLYDLTGTIQSASQINISPGGQNPVFLPGQQPYHEFHQNEYSWYFKDDWKVKPSLTLNLGVRWEFYQAPTEAQGRMLAPIGGAGSVFGISGTNFSSLFNPFAKGGSDTVLRAIGPGTANPDVPLYNSDLNNFAPALGLAYVLPGEGKWRWLSGGKDNMTVRMGYGIAYIRVPIGVVNTAGGAEPGYTETDTTFAYTSLVNLKLPVPPAGVPLTPIPEIGAGSHTQSLYAYDPNLRTAYTQNYNFTITRAFKQDIVLNLGYVGSKTSKLVRAVDTNEVNIYENGILSAFNTVLAGGSSPLLNQIFAPLASIGCANPRTCSLTQSFFLNNNPGGLANFISTSTALGGSAGNLLKTAGLPLNYIVANPQFLHTYLIGNFGNATYDSLQAEVNKRFAKGFTVQGSYVWSHNLGDTESDFSGRTAGGIQDAYRTLRNTHLDKRPLSFDYQSVFKANGLYELPIGKGRLVSTPDWLDRIVGGWQIGATLLAYSGRPLTFTAQNTINNGVGTVFGVTAPPGVTTSQSFTANALGALPAGGVQRDGRGVVYFGGLTQITDPSAIGLAGSSLKAIAGPDGKPLLVNPLPGQFGSLAYGVIRGPGAKILNLNIKKTIRITERFNFQIGATALDATNTPVFSDPDMNINSPTFGRITGTSTSLQAPGNRIMVLQGRFNF